MSTPDRRALLDPKHPELSVRRQCALLSLARSGVYRPVPTEDETDLALMHRIDELFLAHRVTHQCQDHTAPSCPALPRARSGRAGLPNRKSDFRHAPDLPL